MTKVLKDILYKCSLNKVVGNTSIDINEIVFDSRKVNGGDVFVAIRGVENDGHKYIGKAIDSGAVAIICEEIPDQINDSVTYVEVENTASALAYMASNFFDQPSENLKLVGVTGTNGKTTIATLLFKLFKKAGYKVGLLSTVVVKIDDADYPATHTTPDSLKINSYLKMMNEEGVEYCFMEVSSHGIAQNRTAGLVFAGGIFTNLTHDHLDYHNSFAEYRDVKKSFFDNLSKSAFALTNNDDKNGPVMLQNTKAKIFTYALKSMATYHGQILENEFAG
ncbi:Mur ligase family protein, partial [Aegicerativicinus sediminis]